MINKQAKFTAMIVDDSQVMREILRDLLTPDGYSIIAEASDGVEAVTLYNKLKPDLIVMDVLMPLDDGIKATKNIISQNKDAKIVMCSSITDDSLILSAYNAGACGIIFKPFIAEQALEVINSVMQE
ncbi:MAG TPA: response regulator [Geobacteraceae bacterium]|nr:response regulator [Geobacteraceae bacterium]